MASSSEDSSEIISLIDKVKTLMIKIHTLIYQAEYESLYTIALNMLSDTEAARNITDECINETVVALCELDQLKPDEIRNAFKHRIAGSCQKYIDDLNAEKEFQMIHGETIHYDNSSDEEIINAALKALNELPPAARKILSESFQRGSTPRKIAENNNLETETVLKMTWNAKQLLKKIMFNR